MSGRLSLLAHIRQEHSYNELKEKYENIHLIDFEQYYLKELIDYNIKQYGSEWSSIEHEYLKLLYKKFKYITAKNKEYEFNIFGLIYNFETYLSCNSKLHSVVDIIDYD